MAWTSDRVRREFLSFFEEKGHTTVPSSSLMPPDPTLLFTNAGMNQFKPYFLGEVPPPYPRAASVQKCLRAGGKHNDLDNVGFTRRHHTFFEMLGNFSFGDYFKREAIFFAWKLLTERFGLDPDRLYATVFEHDDEAYAIWVKEVGLPENRVFRFGAKDNFWEMGDTGPCGPSSEILYDLGEEADPSQKTPDEEGERFLELWNLVFMQFNRRADGTLEPLPKKNIDTGMGLERILAVLQGELSNYHTDLFLPILEEVARITGVPYDRGEAGAPHRVIADHVRALTFAIADGIFPANFGRGYVLRRILRRAYRFGQRIGVKEEPVLYRLVPVVVEIMKNAYPELLEAQITVQQVVKQEEERFIRTIARRYDDLVQAVVEARDKGVLDGETFFKFYDTYGLPLDLIEEVAQEQGVRLDWEGFEEAMARQRQQARAHAAFRMDVPAWTVLDPAYTGSRFVGYDTLETRSRLVKWGFLHDRVAVVLDETPFYPEGGGQVGDRGWIEGEGFLLEVEDTRRMGSDIIHIGRLRKGTLPEEPAVVQARVSRAHREGAQRAHTGTHLLHAALREILGGHARQQGSLVAPDRIRFDFAHPQAVLPEELEAIEDLVNSKIRENIPVEVSWKSYREALQEGAMALFEEKYGKEVRVITIGGFSKELCGGTHARRTGELGYFRIVKEEGVAAGVRRIEAVVGERAVREARKERNLLLELGRTLRVDPQHLPERLVRVLEEKDATEKALRQMEERYLVLLRDQILQETGKEKNGGVLVKILEDLRPDAVRRLADLIFSTGFEGILILTSRGKQVFLHVRVSPSLTDRYSAVEIVRSVSRELGGGGGGTREKAEGGTASADRLPEILRRVQEELLATLSSQRIWR